MALDLFTLSAKYGSYDVKSGGQEYLFTCPECGKRKLYVNPNKEKGYCQRCHFRISGFDEDSDPFSVGLHGINLVAPPAPKRSWIGVPQGSYRLDVPPETLRNPFEKSEYEKATSYFFSRGFTLEDAVRYNVHFSPHGTYGGRLIFPVTYKKTIYSFAARDYRGRADLPKVLDAPRSVFAEEDMAIMGMDQCVSAGNPYVVIVEGPFDCLAAGSPPAVALGGTALTAAKKSYLLRTFKAFIIFLDPDSAGSEHAKSLASEFNRAGKIVTQVTGHSDDPGGLGKASCSEILSPYIEDVMRALNLPIDKSRI